MKRSLLIVLFLFTLITGAAFAQSTTFTYQGVLQQGGASVTGSFDVKFSLFASDTATTQMAPPVEKLAVSVVNGQFTVPLDFGLLAFPGDTRWLEIATKPAGSATYTPLIPRQQITPTPYALTAFNLALPYTATAALNNNKLMSLNNTGTSGTGLFTQGTAMGLWGASGSGGTGIYGSVQTHSGYPVGVNSGVCGFSDVGNGVYGITYSNTDAAVYGFGNGGIGVQGISTTMNAGKFTITSSTNNNAALIASTAGNGTAITATRGAGSGLTVASVPAIRGDNTDGPGVAGASNTGVGVYGISQTNNAGKFEITNASNGSSVINVTHSGSGVGVYASSNTGSGVQGFTGSQGSAGIIGYNTAAGEAIVGFTTSSIAGAITGRNDGTGYGLHGFSSVAGIGVYGHSATGTGGKFETITSGLGLYVRSASGNIIEGYGSSTSDKKFVVTGTGDVQSDGGFHTPAADFAELLPAVNGLTPGDVLVIGKDGKLARCTQKYQPTVVGVYSTKPAFEGGHNKDNTGKVPLAIMGVVPVKASAENGRIQPGDLLVASATPGHAMKATGNPKTGTVIGKALSGLATGKGIITMLVVSH